MIVRGFAVGVVLTCLVWTAASASVADDLRSVIADDTVHGDLGRTKFAIDRLIDPNIDSSTALRVVDKIVADVRGMTPSGANAGDLVQVLQTVIYEPGPWNSGKPFRYDHGDPIGLDIRKRLLSTYLTEKNGNCITMPLLFLIVAERLDLNMTAGLAPLHVLVRFSDDDGTIHNLETTSGAGRTRESHYRNMLPMADQAVESGIYLRSLTRKETVAVTSMTVVEYLIAEHRYLEALEAIDVVLD